MSEDDNSHIACVRAWMQAAAGGDLARDEKVVLFGRALSAIWARALRTLGEVTLGAIVDRVLHDVADDFPLVGALDVESTGFKVEKLQDMPLDGLDAAIERTLVELLTVIGNLTADILTPGLHAALSAVSLTDASGTEAGGPKG